MICSNGLQIGKDYNNFDLCDECHGVEYNKCKNIRSSCIDKIDWKTEEAAIDAAKRQSTKVQTFIDYHCQYCNGWHIGRSWEV